jgi:hypothetical protein
MPSFVSRLLGLAAVASLAACGRDVTSPDAARSLVPSAPAALLGVNEWTRTISDSTDAFGNLTTVGEYAAGTYTLPNGDVASVGSVTIRTVMPFTVTSSKSCITSTIVSVETTAGWTSSVKKSGGCNQEIAVQFENKSTKKRADFSYLVVPGKTRIDFGAVR